MKQVTVGVYKITSPTGRIYVGQSRDIERRFATYRRLKCESQPKLFASFLKHGVENHYFEVMIECSESELNKWETHFIEALQSFTEEHLNCRVDGEYQVVSEETRKKLSRANKGKKRSIETRMKLSQIFTGRPSPKKGKAPNPLSVEKQRRSIIGKMAGEKNPFYGRKHSAETLAKMRGRSKGIGGMNNRARLVLNLQTGVYYDTAKEACATTTYRQEHFRGMLNGNKKNKTFFVYA